MTMKQLIVDSGRRMHSAKLTVETWGNISCLHNGAMYITPSGMDYCTMTRDDIVVMDMRGAVTDGTRKPSVEAGLHLAIYKARPELRAVIHTHAIYSNVFACIGEDIPLFHDEAAQALGDVVRVAPYCLPGTPELARCCAETLGARGNACLLKNHGAVCVSATMDGCFKVAAVLEMVAELYHRIRAMNCSYVALSDENIAIMREFAQSRYGQ